MSPEGRMIRVVIVDDHELIRRGLSQIIEPEEDLDLVGVAEGGRQGLELVDGLSVDVVLLDVSMPDMNGIEVTRILRERGAEAGIIGLSMYDAAEVRSRIREAGADDYLLKDSPPEEILEAIRRIGASPGN